MKLYDKRLRVLEAIALQGLVSGYKLSKILGISLSHAQWWLSHHDEVRIYEREPVRRERILYGLTMIGLLLALKRPKVRRNFASVFEKFLRYQDDKAIDPKLKENLFDALKSNDVSESFKRFYLAISDALDYLTDIYSMDDGTLFNLATYLASMKEPEKMRLALRVLYSKVLLVQYAVDAYRQYASHLDKIVKGEM